MRRCNRCSVQLLAIVAVTTALTAVHGATPQERANPRPSSDVAVTYDGPFEDVEIAGKKLVYRVRDIEFESPQSTIPKKIVTITKETTVDDTEVKSLLASLRNAKFFGLKEAQGDPEKESRYVYVIQVKDGSTTKRVVFGSASSGSQKPEAFATAEKLILDFAEKGTTITR